MKYESPFLDIAGTGSQLAPTRATNVKISSKRNVLIGISTLFLFLELFVYFSIFLFLYHQRITVEFNKPFSWLNPHNPRFLHYAVFYSVSTLLFAFFVYRSQIYRFRNSLGLSDELLKVCSAASLSILMTIGISFLLKYNDFSRLVVLIYWLSSMLASVLLRFAKRRLFYALAENGSISRNILIIRESRQIGNGRII